MFLKKKTREMIRTLIASDDPPSEYDLAMAWLEVTIDLGAPAAVPKEAAEAKTLGE